MNFKKENLYTLILIVIALLPNILSYFFTSSKNMMMLLLLSIILILLPSLIFKKKVWLWIVFLYVLFAPFEIATLYSAHDRINNVIIASIFLTSKNEATELLSSMIPIIIFSVSLIIIYLVILNKIKSNNYINKKYRIGIFSVIALVFLIQTFITPTAQEGFLNKSKQTIIYFKEKLSYFVYPTDLLYNSAIFLRENIAEKKALENLEHFSLGAKSLTKEPQVVVFVVGETSRAANWSLFGYGIETNPQLKKEDGVFVLSDAYSCANSTFRSIPMLFSNSSPYNYEEWKNTGSITRAYKECNYYTAFIGGQSEGHTIINLIAKKSDYVNYDHGLDGDLFEQAKNIVNKNKQNVFIIIHIMGSHFDYKQRYPKEFDVFKPSSYSGLNPKYKTQIINAYDNSVLYTDYLISNFIDFLKQDGRSSLLYYTADHGENLMDDDRNLMLHATLNFPTIYELHVPSFVWLSDSYQKQNPEKVKMVSENKDKKMSTSISYHSLIDLSNITYPKENKKLSIGSDSFHAFSKRVILSNFKEVIQVD